MVSKGVIYQIQIVGKLLGTKAVFSSQKSLDFGNIAHFVVI